MDINTLRVHKKIHSPVFWVSLLAIATIILIGSCLKALPVAAATSGGSGGAHSWQKGVSFSNGTTSSKYHIDASNIDSSKPIGLVVTLHGDGGCEYYAAYDIYCGGEPYALGGSEGIRAVAQDYNLISVTPLSPDTESGKRRWWQKPVQYSHYLHDLINEIYSKYNIDTSRVWLTGYSGGSELLSQFFFPMYGGTGQFTGGGMLIFAGGQKPTSQTVLQKLQDSPFSENMKQNYRIWWGAGTADLPSSNDPGWMGGYAATQESESYYTNYGFQNTSSYYPAGWCHSDGDAPGCTSFERKFGTYLRQQLEVAYDIDSVDPTVSLTAPTDGATITGDVAISANASDNVGVTKVEFYRGSTKIGEDATSPYQYTWDTTSVANGDYELTAKAFDAAGNTKTSSKITVTINNVSITPIPVTAVTLDGSDTKSLPYFVKQGQKIGHLEHNSNQQVVFSLDCSPSGSDDSLFKVEGNQLIANSDLRYSPTKPLLTVCVEATDAGSHRTSKMITLSLKSPISPIIKANSTTLNSADTVDVTARPTFSGIAEPGSTIQVNDASSARICEVVADTVGNWSCTAPKDLASGSHTFYVKIILPNNSGEQNVGPYKIYVPSGVSSSNTVNNRDENTNATSDKKMAGILVPNTGIASSGGSFSVVGLLLGGIATITAIGVVLYRRYRTNHFWK